MKKPIFFLATVSLSFCFLEPLFAQNVQNGASSGKKTNALSFSIEAKAGARLGVYDEIVWAKKSTNGERYKESELNYQTLPVFYAGIDFAVSYKRLNLSLLSKFFFAQKSGTLKDSDWRNDAYCKNGDTSTKTDYSEHDLFLLDKAAGIAGYDIELESGLEFHPARFLTLEPLFSFNAQYMSFSAKNGMGWYGLYDSKNNSIASYDSAGSSHVYNFDGKTVLEYEVYNLFFWTGLRAKFDALSWLRVELASEVAPFSIFLDFDRHLTNHGDYKEISCSAFYAFRQTVKAEFKIKKWLSICQKSSFVFSGPSEGEMQYKKSEDSSYSKVANNSGGGALIALDLELSVKFSW